MITNSTAKDGGERKRERGHLLSIECHLFTGLELTRDVISFGH